MKISPSKLEWIKDHIRHGDIPKICQLLPEVNYTEIAAVLAGRLIGEHGVTIIEVTIAFLEKRKEDEKNNIERVVKQL